MELPILYKLTKTGAIQQYKVNVTKNIITVEQGQTTGKKQVYTTTISEGKNIGKKNETTPEMQAELEAISKHSSKLKDGYTLDPSGEILVNLPMKVKSYWDQLKNVIFPCYASPKLNGVNCTFRIENHKLNRYSRGGLLQPELPHLTEIITNELKKLKTSSLNGELYKHGAYLEDIDSASKKTNEFSSSLEFHLFELPDIDTEYKDKVKILKKSALMTPEILMFNNHDELKEYHAKCVADGYEGIIIRNSRCKYTYNERSSDAFKMKIALDAEFKIVSCESDKNGHPVFTLESYRPDKKTFKAKPNGDAVRKIQILKDFDTKYKGKWYKVEFESISKYGMPAKPIGICLRDCDTDGNPLE